MKRSPPSPPQMRLREQTGWGFAGTLLKKVPEKGDENRSKWTPVLSPAYTN